MFIHLSSIFAFCVVGLLFLLPFLEKKGLFLNKNISSYYHKLKYILKNEINIESKNILESAQTHLASEYRSYKKQHYPLEYTKDLIEHTDKYDTVLAWCYIFIIFNLKDNNMFESEINLKFKKSIIELCYKNIENISFPSSFKNYFKV